MTTHKCKELILAVKTENKVSHLHPDCHAAQMFLIKAGTEESLFMSRKKNSLLVNISHVSLDHT